MLFSYNDLSLIVKNGVSTFTSANVTFKEDETFEPYLVAKIKGEDLKFYFKDAESIKEERVENALFIGMKTIYKGFAFDKEFSFATLSAIEKEKGCFFTQLNPVKESTEQLMHFSYPRPISFKEVRSDWYSVITVGEGALIPNDSKQNLVFDHRWDLDVGLMNGRSNTMPWYGLVRENQGFMALALDDRDAGFYYSKEPNQPIHLENIQYSELGRMAYPRRMRYFLFDNADYNTFCTVYKHHIKSTNEFVSLRVKEAKNPLVAKLNKGGLIHTYIHMHVVEECETKHMKTPIQMEDLIPFEVKTEQIKKLYANGLKDVTIHVDGWINKGYDNQHPDVFPVCPEAGGEEAFKEFIATCHSFGYLVVIHDQYRDFYLDAPSYDQNFSLVDSNREIQSLSIWDGGKQEFFCTRFSGYFVDRNFDTLAKKEILIDGAYLDVFSCMHLDECYSAEHPMTRRECLELRKACFESVKGRGMIVQSEELLSWTAPILDFCHHSPYQEVTIPDNNYLVGKQIGETIGIPVPLTSLCYHDSIVIPWFSVGTKFPYYGLGYLPCILYGGIPYVDIDSNEAQIATINEVLAVHEKVKYAEMISHRFLDKDGKRQQTRFSNGVVITVDFELNSYEVSSSN